MNNEPQSDRGLGFFPSEAWDRANRANKEGRKEVEMNNNPAEQFLEDLLPYLERLDAQIGAVVQVLKEKGMTTDEEFTAKVEQANVASEVRDRGLRVRIEHFVLTSSQTRKQELIALLTRNLFAKASVTLHATECRLASKMKPGATSKFYFGVSWRLLEGSHIHHDHV